MKTVSRKQAVLAHLRLDRDADVEKIAQYLGHWRRRKSSSVAGSVASRREDCTLNVVCLLPTFARDHLYRYPFGAPDDKGVKEDCYWSAFNFFCNTPDNRINDFSYMGEVLRRDYYRIEGPQLGDLVFLAVGEQKTPFTPRPMWPTSSYSPGTARTPPALDAHAHGRHDRIL